MSPVFTYMGTKKRIASQVAQVISHARRGPLLDLFAGISCVGSAVAPRRNIWCNDVQHFAHALATSIFTAREAPRLNSFLVDDIAELATVNRRKLQAELHDFVSEEERVLQGGSFKRAMQLGDKLVRFCESARNLRMRRLHRRDAMPRPYRLFSITYAGGYIGVKQAIDLDSLRYALDQLLLERHLNKEQHRWLLLGLCKALANVSHTTGHFAQYLSIKKTTYTRFLAKRRRDVFSEWCDAVEKISPEGTEKWRNGNRTFRKDAISLLKELPSLDARPSIIYADPPYTKDHYSRYYHLLDTLLLYDYPDPIGKGQYRSGRFSSEFSVQTKVYSAFHDLISGAAKIGCDLVINYPEIGLLENPRNSLLQMMKQYYPRAEIALTIPHEHSSLGASKGVEKSAVTELVFYAHGRRG
jgi:adenine-specific DNA-methyltransferase